MKKMSGIELSDEGVELSDGGTILFPERWCGTIRRIDYWGNKMESRCPEDDNYEDWNELFSGTEHYYTGDDEE
jgi:hypothetical protein